MNITLCASCVLGQSGFAVPLSDALTDAGIAHRIALTECLSGCTRASTISFRATGKTAYLFGDLVPDDLAGLVTFARHYAATPDGTFADARVLGQLRTKAIARIPG